MSAHFTDEFLIHYGVPGMKKGQKMSPEEKAARERLRYERQVAAANRRAAAQQRKANNAAIRAQKRAAAQQRKAANAAIRAQKKAARESKKAARESKKAAAAEAKKKLEAKRTAEATLLRSHRMSKYQAAVARANEKTFRPGMMRTLPIDRSKLNQQFGSVAEMRKNAARRR